MNAVSLALLAVSALSWAKSDGERKAATIVVVVEAVAIVGE